VPLGYHRAVRLLILGGSVFLGRALTDAALDRGHAVTHFRRGTSGAPDPRVETILGDRTGTLEALDTRAFDAVADTSGYLPQVVRRSAEKLRGRVERYLFVSSVSVYERFDHHGVTEDEPVAAPLDPVPDTMTWDKYGNLKAMCEAVVRDVFGERALIVRPGLIVGPHDSTDRFTYWPHRVSLGGRVVAPVRPGLPIQYIDVRDLAEWMVALLERGVSGAFNATGMPGTATLGDLLETCRHACGSDARFEWMDAAFLAAHGARHWTKMPLQVPEDDPSMKGFASVSVARALAEGLRFRSEAQTVADTLAWSRTRATDHTWKAGLSPDEEQALLADWDARTRAGARA
jgi:2'-hydroxyisoflavone reductase